MTLPSASRLTRAAVGLQSRWRAWPGGPRPGLAGLGGPSLVMHGWVVGLPPIVGSKNGALNSPSEAAFALVSGAGIAMNGLRNAASIVACACAVHPSAPSAASTMIFPRTTASQRRFSLAAENGSWPLTACRVLGHDTCTTRRVTVRLPL